MEIAKRQQDNKIKNFPTPALILIPTFIKIAAYCKGEKMKNVNTVEDFVYIKIILLIATSMFAGATFQIVTQIIGAA